MRLIHWFKNPFFSCIFFRVEEFKILITLLDSFDFCMRDLARNVNNFNWLDPTETNVVALSLFPY
jgi:hypothetical protein